MADLVPAAVDLQGTRIFFSFRTKPALMASRFGHGFITNIMLIAEHFGLPPESAWMGVGDHVEGLVVPDRFSGTEIDELTTLLRKKVIWHTPGSMDKEDARDVIRVLNRLVVAIDKELGIADAEVGEFR
jgi:hypothetical protein